MHKRRATVVLLTAAALALGVVAPARAAERSSWPLGVSAAPASPIPERDNPGLVALGRGRVMVFGGGAMGESVDRPDGHSDGAILSLSTKRWTRIADMPFPIVLPAAVWNGRTVIVVGGVPRCADQQCRASSTRAGVYDPTADSWRELTVPRSLTNYGSMDPLGWTGREALFLHAQEIVAVTPAGKWRVVPLPGIVAVGAVCGTGATVAVLSSRLLQDRAPDDATTELLLYDARADRWTTTTAAPAATVFASLLCTDRDVVPVPGEVDRPPEGLVRYDTVAQQWSAMPTPTFTGFVPCTGIDAACDLPRWAAHGTAVDGWLVGKEASGQRFGTRAGTWTPIATGPDLQPLAPPGDMVWAGRLGATFATVQGPGSGTGRSLLVYRPI